MPTRLPAILLIVGLTFAVFTQVAFLVERSDFSTRMFDGDTWRPEWSGRIFTAGLAELVHADGHEAHWTAGWFLLSALAWLIARGRRCIGPVALLAVVVLATFHPTAPFGMVASEGPVVFFFTLAAITRRKAGTWWPLIGLVAIPFKQTGGVLVAVAALLWLRDWRWRHALWLLGAGAGIGWLAAYAGGGSISAAFTTHSLSMKSYPVDNLRHWSWAIPFMCAGTVIAGLLAARGPVLLVMLLLSVAVLCMGQAWEPRIWLEVATLSAGVLADRGVAR